MSLVQIFHPCLLLSSSTGYQTFKHGFQISKHVRACRHVEIGPGYATVLYCYILFSGKVTTQWTCGGKQTNIEVYARIISAGPACRADPSAAMSLTIAICYSLYLYVERKTYHKLTRKLISLWLTSHTTADKVALPAFAAACRAAARLMLTAGPPCSNRRISPAWPPGPQLQTRSSGVRRPYGTDRQTGGQTDGRPTVA